MMHDKRLTSADSPGTDVARAPAGVEVMRFEMTHNFFKGAPDVFSNLDAPDWLTGENIIPGSTMDNHHFWQEHVLTLQVGDSVETDFRTIKRTA